MQNFTKECLTNRGVSCVKTNNIFCMFFEAISEDKSENEVREGLMSLAFMIQ